MREILFRGKRVDNGEWVEGGINTVDGLTYIACSVICGENTDRPFNFLHEVDPATVSQYTGLNDKNGRKIFEGDRVRVSNGNPFEQTVATVIGTVLWHSMATRRFRRNTAARLD